MALALLPPNAPQPFQKEFRRERVTTEQQIATTVRTLTPKQIHTLFHVIKQFNRHYSKPSSLMEVAKQHYAKHGKEDGQIPFTTHRFSKSDSLMAPPQQAERRKDDLPKPLGIERQSEEPRKQDLPFTLPVLCPPQKSMDQLGRLFYADGMQRNALDTLFTEDNCRTNQRESEQAHHDRLEKLKEQIRIGKETNNWGTAIQVFSWIGSLLGILTGIALIASGVGAVAGAFLIAAGVMTAGSQILEITGGWSKIAKLLPEDTPERRAAILTWIQIAIVVLSVIMGCVGGVIGGFSALTEGMQFANALFGGIVLVGFGVTQVGKAIKDRELKYSQAALKTDEVRITKLEQKIEDDNERLEENFSTYQHLSNLISTIFRIRIQTFKAIMRS